MAVLTRSLFAALLLAAAALAGCFSARQPPCAFSCAGDGVCHHDDDPGTCDIPAQIDAGDAGATDVASTTQPP